MATLSSLSNDISVNFAHILNYLKNCVDGFLETKRRAKITLIYLLLFLDIRQENIHYKTAIMINGLLRDRRFSHVMRPSL